MSDLKMLLSVRKMQKARKPNFLREDYDKKSLGIKWRRPTGRHSKIKHQFKGNRKMPSCGYRSPVLVRGLTRDGYLPVIVHTLSELNMIDAGKTVVIGSTVGERKRIMLLKKSIELGLKVYNWKDAAAALKSIEEKRASTMKKVKEQKQEEKKDIGASKAVPAKEQSASPATPPKKQKPAEKKGEAA